VENPVKYVPLLLENAAVLLGQPQDTSTSLKNQSHARQKTVYIIGDAFNQNVRTTPTANI
jgi:hypothetical protein